MSVSLYGECLYPIKDKRLTEQRYYFVPSNAKVDNDACCGLPMYSQKDQMKCEELMLVMYFGARLTYL